MPSPDQEAPDRATGPRIDRRAVVRRHVVEMTGIDPAAPLSVGNGELCATVDVTGLQTFPAAYPVADAGGGSAGTLLGTQSQWGWHSVPRPEGADPGRALRPYRTRRGEVPYVDSPPMPGGDESALDAGLHWLRANPHRLDLARIGLVLRDGHRVPEPGELGTCHQTLDPWTGLIESDVELAGHRFRVTTACHPDEDVLAVRIRAAEAAGLPVAVRFAFPYGSQSWSNAADWSRPGEHVSRVEPVPGGALVHRRFDDADEPLYVVRVRADGAAVRTTGDHEVVVETDAGTLELVVGFGSAAPPQPPDADAVVAASARHWPEFWHRGAALDLAGSTDPRADELERRVVLSQYLTAIQCAGSLPPQETGLTCNSWRGRFHLEMHWWHAAHFALWGRPDLLRRSMDFYRRILPVAEETARRQGCRGARWPKQVGPDGAESPSHIGPFLLWQQPHVIHLAELLRRAGDPDAERYGELVEATAWFMADVAEPTPEGFELGPPLVPAQESYADIRHAVTNPPFELAYWSWALGVAQQWRQRAGRPPEPLWDEVGAGMARPLVRDGRYPAVAMVDGTGPYTVPADHPSMVYALGLVPATPVVDPGVVRATLRTLLEPGEWDWESTWGWDFPALAMTATRLHESETAVAMLLRETPKNRHVRSGHNRQTDTLPVYLPGNGGLLAAVALMAAGWDRSGDRPGFPQDGTWTVRHEGFVPAP